MEEPEKDPEKPHAPTELIEPEKRNFWQRLKHAIIYGGEQTFFCLATDPLEPYVNKLYQNKYGDHDKKVSSFQTYASEFAGDGAAFFAFVAIKTFLATPVNWAISGVRAAANPFLEWRANKSMKRWAAEHEVDEKDPRYTARLEQYKTLGAENLVDSGIIAGSAATLNLLAQRHLLKNDQSYLTMAKGKVAGTLMTFGAMWLTSTFFPRAKRKVEKTIESKMMDPVMNFMKHSLGMEEDVAPVITKSEAGQTPSAAISLSAEKREGLLALVAEHAMKIDFHDPKARAALLGKQKAVYQAFIKVLDAQGPLVPTFIEEHYETVEKAHDLLPGGTSAEMRLHDREASRVSVLASLAHKRRDMQQFIELLDDATFLKEIEAVIASRTIPERHNSTITPEQRTYMSQSLLKHGAGADPKVSIMDTAENQALDYQALAHALKPDGPGARILAAELKKHLPDYDPHDIDGIAKDYMQYYQKEALIMAAEFESHSATVKQALTRAETLRHKYHPPQTVSHAMAT